MMRATRRGVALVRQRVGLPANDNVAGTITPDDRPFLAALALICAGIVALAIYAALSPPADDVMSLLRR